MICTDGTKGWFERVLTSIRLAMFVEWLNATYKHHRDCPVMSSLAAVPCATADTYASRP